MSAELATRSSADAAYLTGFTLNTATGGAIYVLAIVVAVLLACILAAQRLLGAAAADDAATVSLLQLGGAAAACLIFVGFVIWAGARGDNPLGFRWMPALGLGAIVATALYMYVLPRSSPLAALQDGVIALGAGGGLNGGPGSVLSAVGSDATSAAVLAAAATVGAAMDYATGAMRADRTGSVLSAAACAAVVAAAVFYVLVQLGRMYSAQSGAPAVGAAVILAAFVASSWFAAKAANVVAGYSGAPVKASSVETLRAAQQTKAVVSAGMVSAVVLPLLVYYTPLLRDLLRDKVGETAAPSGGVDTTALTVVCAALACWIPAVAIVSAFALRVRDFAPLAYSLVATCVLAAAVYSAGRIVPWTAELLWLAVFGALAAFANLSIRGRDGGPRKLAIALMLAAGFGAAQMVGAKMVALVPATLVLFALWQTGRPVAPAAIFAAALVWSAIDGGGQAQTGADPAVLIGRTCAALAAATLLSSEVFHASDQILQYALANLNIFSVGETSMALGLGRALLVALLGMLVRDSVRGVMMR